MDYLYLTFFIVIAILGIFLTVFQLPGTWLILASAIAYDWHHQWQRFGWVILAGLAGLALMGEIVETMSGVVMAKRAGASRRAAFGALIGGFAGMILFSIPIPIIGTIAGGMLGCFLGALIAELTKRDDLDASIRIGASAAIGRLIGLIAKMSLAFAMAGWSIGIAIWRAI